MAHTPSTRPTDPGGRAAPVTTARIAVPAITGSTLITCLYNAQPRPGIGGDLFPVGLAWCHLFDNPVYAWLIDPSATEMAIPVIVGTMPDWTPPPTENVKSPRWAVREDREIFIPDEARGDMHWFLNYIAFNNGATRQLYADFSDTNFAQVWNNWVRGNPDYALSEPPKTLDD